MQELINKLQAAIAAEAEKYAWAKAALDAAKALIPGFVPVPAPNKSVADTTDEDLDALDPAGLDSWLNAMLVYTQSLQGGD